MDRFIGERRLSIGGMTLECRMIGPPPTQAPTFVLLHEGLGSMATWGDLPHWLSERTGAGVFAYSRAGYGESPSSGSQFPVDYIQRHAREVVPSILDAIGLQSGLLLGHSDGASMAAAYAGSCDDPRIRGLVLMAPHFCVEKETLAEIRRAREAFETRDLRRRLARYHADVDVAFRGWNDVWLDRAFATFNLREELSRIRVPMLIIRGDDDRYGTHRQARIAEEVCRCRLDILLLPECAHIPYREQPQQTIEAIVKFYKSLGLGVEGKTSRAP
jgi:pimeloyl-ACP methyl ester carboxylesterase